MYKVRDMKKALHFTKSNVQMLNSSNIPSPFHYEGQQQLDSLETGSARAEQAQVTAEICLGSLPVLSEAHLVKICYS